MKKLLYITASPKPEELSASRQVGRKLVEHLQKSERSLTVEELNLYHTTLPKLQYHYFSGRNTLITADMIMDLPQNEKDDLTQISRLSDQFVSADVVVLASPMWSLSYPAAVKEYLDLIITDGKTIAFEEEKPYGLLNDRKRVFVYVQSSGASLPFFLRPILNKGMSYVEDIMKFLGFAHFYPLYVDGTGTTRDEEQTAIHEAVDKIPDLVGNVLHGIQD